MAKRVSAFFPWEPLPTLEYTQNKQNETNPSLGIQYAAYRVLHRPSLKSSEVRIRSPGFKFQLGEVTGKHIILSLLITLSHQPGQLCLSVSLDVNWATGSRSGHSSTFTLTLIRPLLSLQPNSMVTFLASPAHCWIALRSRPTRSPPSYTWADGVQDSNVGPTICLY